MEGFITILGLTPQKGSERIDISIVSNLLRSGRREDCRSALTEAFGGADNRALESVMLRIYSVVEVYITAKEFTSKLGVEESRFVETFGTVDSLNDKVESYEKMMDFLCGMLETCITWRSGSQHTVSNENMEKALRHIDEHYSENELSLSSVASAVNLAPTYFSGLFKNNVGVNFVEYLNSLRIEKAKEMLCCTTLRVNEISEKVGYSDYRYFGQVFKKYTGESPKSYQKTRFIDEKVSTCM